MNPADFDPTATSFSQDPYSIYAKLRALPEPFYFEPHDAWLLARYEDVEAAARNSNLVRSLEGLRSIEEIAAAQRAANWHDMLNHEPLVQNSMLENDGEMHDRIRLIVLKELSRRFVEQQRPMIQRHVNRLLEEVLEQSEFDFVNDFAAHVPGYVIGSIIGVPDEDCPQLRIWSENVVQYFDVDRSDERKKLAETATSDFQDYLLQLIADRRRAPQDDLLTRLMTVSDEGQLDQTELVSTCMLILMAGHGSTIDVLGSGMHTLLSFPDQLDKLKQQPAFIDSAVQEMFRLESPLPFFHRYLREDMTLGGKHLSRGAKVGLLYGAANRDPSAFPDADRFDITRVPNRHVAFGRGAHLCLGNHLSRLDMEVIFNTLLRRCDSIELLEEAPVYKPGLSVRGPKSLRIRIVQG